MSKTYVLYDQHSMKVLGLERKQPEIDSDIMSFEIDDTTANSFLLGAIKLQDYVIAIVDDIPTLEKKVFKNNFAVSFWNLKCVDGEENFNFVINDNVIEIHSVKPIDNYILYASVKNDPSWLLYTWHFEADEIEGSLTLHVENASNYSYSLRKIK